MTESNLLGSLFSINGVSYINVLFQSRENVTRRILEETEGIMVHPNQEPAVIAGQGTIAMEVLNQVRAVNSCLITGKADIWL